jgi:glycerol-3-phosphate dehydrogenase
MPSGVAFSAGQRERQWSALGEGTYDLLVIGGGVTGAGVARDAAGRGLRVALVEASDIGGGTSSRSSRLVHGGLRYLENLDFGLVFEALRERRRLLELAPHLVRPLPFLFPVYEGDPTGLAKLTAGMWLYEMLSLFRAPKVHRMLRRSGALEAEPQLRSEGLTGGALYYDAQVDDARLTLAIARGAFEAGAIVVTRARVVGLAPQLDASGVAEVEDGLRQRRTNVRARVIVNAAGPWSDRVRSLANPNVATRLRTTKGVHVLVERDRVGNRNGLIFRSRIDGRVMFVLPWGGTTYIGTTDTEYSGDPADVVAEEEDIRYLLESANATFPRANLQLRDVFSTWAGVRPLLAPDVSERLSESATSREHEIWRDPNGLLNIAGGKLTTYRSMAAETADAVATILEDTFGVRSGRYYTEYLPLPGAPEADTPQVAARAAPPGVDPAVVAHLVARYGSDASEILGLIEEDPALGTSLVPGRPYLRAEVVHAARHELALTIEDVLRRRLQLFYEVADGGLSAARDVAALLAAQEGIGWDAAFVEEEIQRYADAVRRTRPAVE